MCAEKNNWMDALDRAAELWISDDTDGALSILDRALVADPDQPFLRIQKYSMEKALEFRTGIPTIEMPPSAPGDPVVSVVMASYNRNVWIRESIESVLSQTFPDWELVVVNDGGTSELEEVVSSYGDSRLRYVYAQHGGLSSALNWGLRNSRGKYIGFLDDDDLYYPEHLEKLVAALDADPSAPAAYSDYINANQARRGKQYVIRRRKYGRIFDFDLKKLMLINYIQPNTILVRRDGILKHGGYNEKLAYTLDHDLWIRLAKDGDFVRVPEATCEYRKREDGSNMSSDLNFRHSYFYNGFIAMHKSLLIDSNVLSVWGKKGPLRAIKILLKHDPEIIDTIDLRHFFKVEKPYTYLLDLAKRGGARVGDRRRERILLKAAIAAAPHEIKLWKKLITGVEPE